MIRDQNVERIVDLQDLLEFQDLITLIGCNEIGHRQDLWVILVSGRVKERERERVRNRKGELMD